MTDIVQQEEIPTQESNPFKDFLNKNSGKYLKFDEANTPIEGIYLGFSEEDDKFNPGAKRLVYNLEINQQTKFLGSGSKRLAGAFSKANPKKGNFVRITRVGEGFKTDYTVESSDIPF